MILRAFAELRAEVAGDTLRGHAAVFGSIARLPSGYEAIAPGAFARALDSSGSDPAALINHNPSLLLGRRSSGTLRLKEDDEGLAFEVDLGQQSYARDLRESVERGDLTGMSFGFLPGEYEFSPAKDGRQIRTHTAVSELLDVSAVTYPAYREANDLQLRSLDSFTFQLPVRLIRAKARLALGGHS